MFTLVDYESLEEFGPFPTHGEARIRAESSGLKSYSIHQDGELVEFIGPTTTDTDSRLVIRGSR